MKDGPGEAPQVALVCGLVRDGGTALLERHVEWPWSLPRGYRRAGRDGPLTVLPQCAGAALLPGDRWRHRIEAQAGAKVDMISAGALLVHADRKRPRVARSDWELMAGEGAVLRHLQDPNVLMTGARMAQRIDLTLAPGATAVLFDGMCRQSPEAGDAGGWWLSDLQVTAPGGRVLLRDRQRVSEADLAGIRALPGGAAAFGTVTMLGADRGALGQAFPKGPMALRDCYAACGAARGGAGLVLRIAARTGGALDRAFRHVRERLSP
ncbi:urease accessory protein UreD [Salipiger bermudensis]|uniref:urease accessory protein UreD n=1 Tax=Salipiger bermudensis TaxID=344736 RepID=UPI001CD22650|nr:urease accessory protein UreD [Salipiger bermudensis]MCA1287841.1 urease accessory protein UreD [Salipiger bermudensis]